LPAEQKAGIQSYIVDYIIKLSSDFPTMERNKVILGKMNLVLVQVSASARFLWAVSLKPCFVSS
jgi:hypothetical protein